MRGRWQVRNVLTLMLCFVTMTDECLVKIMIGKTSKIRQHVNTNKGNIRASEAVGPSENKN